MTLTTPDFTREIRDRLEAPQCAYDLMKAASHLVDMRMYDGVLEYGIPHFRSQMKKLWPEHKKKCVVAVDLDNTVHMSWAVQFKDYKHEDGATHRAGDPEHAMKMLRNIYTATSPNTFICCHDLQPRKKIEVEGYKEGRPQKPREFYAMFDVVKQTLKDKGMQVEGHDGYEADDVMASIAFRCQLLEMECVLVGTDKDIFQCLGKGTAIYNPTSKEWKNADWLKQKFRVTPAQWTDWLCMVGGKNSLEGCHRVGDKTASDLLEAWGDFCKVYDHRETMRKDAREGVEAFYPRYWDIKAAHTLARSVSVGWGPKCNSEG